jgi:hypothetical protein
MDDLGDTLPSESFLSESPFDIVENLSMGRICLVEDIPQLEIGGA